MRSKSIWMAFIAVVSLVIMAVMPAGAAMNERTGMVTVSVKLKAPEEANQVRLWIPYPLSDDNQSIEDVTVSGNYAKQGVYREAVNGNMALYAEWNGGAADRSLTYTFKIRRKAVQNGAFPKKELPFSREEFSPYLKATSLGPTDGKVRETAERITKGKKTVLARSRAIYDWIVTNMHRDPSIKGCGYGDVEKLLASLGGKCGDIHSVYVALARSVGVPAREIFGMRLPKGAAGDMTKGQHCWAEFYLPGHGWVPVDPSDVRKAMLEKKTQDLKNVGDLVALYFGGLDPNRVAFQSGRDLILNPAQQDGPLNYFMYPYAEADGKALNEDLFGFNLGYTITFREL